MDGEKEKKHSGGRPKKAILRNKFVGVRFTAEEYRAVKKKAAEARFLVSDFLRQAALKVTINSRLSDEEMSFVRQLTGMANNLNQIVHRGHTEGFVFALIDFTRYREKIDALIHKLSL
jgi:hypothetical protein